MKTEKVNVCDVQSLAGNEIVEVNFSILCTKPGTICSIEFGILKFTDKMFVVYKAIIGQL